MTERCWLTKWEQGKRSRRLLHYQKVSELSWVVPAAVKYNWENEIKLWRSDYKVHICNGKNSFKMPELGEISIVNYEILPDWLTPTKEEQTSFGKTIKVAEFTRGTNFSTQRNCTNLRRVSENQELEIIQNSEVYPAC